MSAMTEYLTEVSARLKRVVIENQDFEKIIKSYDRPGALFYLDPPYYEAEKYYPDRFNPDDHERLRAALGNIKGRYLLSYNNCSEIKEMYKDYTIIEEDRQHNLSLENGRTYHELIIRNY